MSRVLLLAALLLTAVRAGAQRDRTDAPVPGTSKPSSGNCGLDPRLTPAQMKDMIQAAFDDTWSLSGVAKPKLIFDIQRNLSPAHMMAAPPKKNMAGDLLPDSFEVHYNPGLCVMAHSLAEVSFVFGHELGHIVHKYVEVMDAKEGELEKLCGGRTGDCFKKPRDDYKAEQEAKADAFGLQLLKKGRYNAEAEAVGQKFMNHLSDAYWCIGIKNTGDDYPTPKQRAEMLRSAP